MNRAVLGILLCVLIGGCSAPEKCVPLYTPTAEEDKALDDLEHRAFNYLWNEVYPETGIAVDHTQNRIGKVAATGFELAAITIGVKRGWITYEQGYDRTWKILNVFYDDPNDPNDPYVDGHFGLYWHFVNGRTGKLEPIDCVAMCDSADFIGGAVVAGEFFKGTPVEELAKKIYDNVEWDKFVKYKTDGTPGLLSFGWVPPHVSKGDYYEIDGLLPYDMSGFADNSLLIYVLGLGSDTHPIPQQTWETYVDTYTLDEYEGYEAVMTGSGALFSRQVPHSFIRFSRKRDRKIDYFLEIVNKILADRAFNVKVNGYPPELWGLTDCFGKDSYGHGAPPGQVQNDGTVGSTAFVGGLPFVPEVSFASMKYVKDKFGDRVYGKYGFTSSVNLKNNYVSPLYVGIEVGPMIMLVENYRSGLIWDLFSRSGVMKNFVKRAGMSGVVDDFELPPEAPPYAYWYITGGAGKIGWGDNPQNGHKYFKITSDGGPVTLEAKLSENDLTEFNYCKYLSLWTRGMNVNSCAISYGGKKIYLKRLAGLDGFGWKHHYFSLPDDIKSGKACGISIKCEAAGKDAAVDNISFEAKMDKYPPERITGLQASTGRIGGAIDLAWTVPEDKANDRISRYILKISDGQAMEKTKDKILLPVSQFPGNEKRTVLIDSPGPVFLSMAAIDAYGHIGQFSKPVRAEPNHDAIDLVAFKCGKNPVSSVELSNAGISASAVEDESRGDCLQVKYTKTHAWDYIAFPLDPAMVAAHRYIIVTVKGKVDILGKLWCSDDFQFDMERKESDSDTEWTSMKFDTYKVSQIITSRDDVKKLIMFHEPGKWKGEGVFLIDRIEYSN
ncbi:MAG TPA: glucoamylase family protein [Candidatus Omnitrophota bacterium]|nr:hypothetical protein [Candidatus Omnitrophota bacterium]HOX09645.1 glucoamylase family protein [Candidatus Omnitrophota bacterium]HRZ67483.1 glucoamylase family protein [Candidatus Omnitrophota bacterium]